MNAEIVEQIANAVLYEGYILYPYRPSAIKNQQRWNFGTLAPGEFMQTECLVVGGPETLINIRVRFLQMMAREGQVWNEAVERSVPSGDLRLGGLDHTQVFAFGAEINGNISTIAVPLRTDLFRLTVRITNRNPLRDGDRETILLRSLVSTHTILNVTQGQFVSLLDPPESYRDEAAQCRNLGTWPVLAGAEGTKETLLSSPIILYDYPQIAPESTGDYFDGTEMDEMLALRVLTLTDEEKRQMQSGDERARRILERTEMMPNGHMQKLHGAVRGMGHVEEQVSEKAAPGSIRVFGINLKKGDRVRLWPKRGGDVFDMALEGKTAVIDMVEQDLEDRIHLAVIVEDDPGRDLGAMRQPGHRFFFSPEEVEPLALESRV